MRTITTIKDLEGKTLFTGRNWARRWSRIEWIVKGGMAHPLERHNFWCSVAGEVDNLLGEEPRAITLEEIPGRWDKGWVIEGHGFASTSKF
jgi:hypothetical protein